MPRNQAGQVAAKDEKKAAPITKVAPVRSRRRDTDTRDQKIGQDQTRAMRSRGPAKESLDGTNVEVVERVVTKEHLAALAFMEEVVVVLVHESNNPTDEPYPEVWNDGVCQRFQRGKEMPVKRKYIEVLARAKKTSFSNEKYKDGNGDDAYRYPSHTALRYPFSILKDPSGDKGAAWLKGILAEA